MRCFIIYTLLQTLSGWSNEGQMGRAQRVHNAYKVTVRKSEVERLNARPRITLTWISEA
jgi:hypothetical protein